MLAKKLIPILILFVFLFPIVTAQSNPIEVTHKANIDTILPGETADFVVFLRNNQPFQDEFSITVPNVRWDAYTYPLTDSIKKIGPKQTESVIVKLKPSQGVTESQCLSLVVSSTKQNNVSYKDLLCITVVAPPKKVYLFNISLIADNLINPLNDNVVKANITNKGDPLVFNLTLQTSFFNQTKEVNLTQNQSIVEEFTISHNTLMSLSPGNYNLMLLAQYNNVSIAKNKSVEIKKVDRLVSENSTTRRFLLKEQRIVVKNNGNYPRLSEVELPISLFTKLFTKANKDYTTLSKGNKNYLVFATQLEPGQTTEIIVTANYRSLAILILLLIALLSIYLLVRSPLAFRKRVITIRKAKGGLVGMKIILEIKNKSSDELKDVKIVDKIPKLFEYKEMPYGVKPSKIEKQHTGSIIKWELSKLAPKEERIISYRVQSKIEILGTISLGAAAIKFKKRLGKSVMLTSNTFSIKGKKEQKEKE